MAGNGERGGGGPGRALTPQRRAVLRVVAESDGHLTANEIFEAARKALPSISFATVYNSLKYLRAAGLIRVRVTEMKQRGSIYSLRPGAAAQVGTALGAYLESE